MSREQKMYNHRGHTGHGGKGQKSKLSVLIALIFGIVLLSLFGCPNVWMEEILKPLIDKENTNEIPVIYTVTFDSNGGSLVKSQSVAEGEKATRPDNPTKDGYGFVNWYDNEDCTDPHYDFDTPVTADITLYAKWLNLFNEQDFGPTPYVISNIFDVYNEEEWNAAKTAISGGGDNKNYIINVMDDFDVAGAYTNTFGDATGIKVSLRGATYQGYDRTVGCLPVQQNVIRTAADQTVILRDLTLKGCSNNYSGVVYVAGNNSAFVMRSGEISGNYTYSGGGVYVDGGTFTMYGGVISGNTSYAMIGGGVYVKSGTFTMYGGEISGNTPNTSGGGVYVNTSGTFTMHSGKISGNTASSGGGVYVNTSGTFTMHGGEISGNNITGTANTNNGGGVYVASNGNFTMNGGKISGNTSGYYGGGVCVTASGIFHIVNGTIYGNTEANQNLRNNAATNQGAALYPYNNSIAEHGRFDGTGGAWKAVGTLATTNNTITVVNGELILPKATAPDDVEDFGLGATIHGTFDVYNEADWNAAKLAITEGGDGKNYVINVMDNFDASGSADPTFGDAAGIKVSLRGDKTLTLLISTRTLICIGSDQTVILRGPTLKGPSGTTNGNLVIVDGTFTMQSGAISDNKGNGGGVTVNSGGTFTMNAGTISGNAPFWNNGGGVSSGGTFTMNGGTISGNSGGVTVGGGTFTMNAGTISDNKGNGCGVTVRGGTFDMRGGTISGNTANNGGGVYVDGNGGTATFNMYGGEISGNTATSGGAGVLVDGSGGIFRIINGTIYGNEASLDPNLKNTAGTVGASLYISTDSTAQYGTFNGGTWSGNDFSLTYYVVPNYGYTKYYTNDTIEVKNGELIRPKIYTATDDEIDFGPNPVITRITVSSLADWEAAIETITNGGTNKNYVINVTGTVDVPGVTANTFGSAAGVKVSLRGSGTLALSSTGYIIYTNANQRVILRDLTLQGISGNNNAVVQVMSANTVFVMHSGKITGNNRNSNGAGVNIYDGTFTMYGGEISGNTSTGSGGGVHLNGSAIFTMHGGTISNNTATANGGGVNMNTDATFRFVAGTIYGNTEADTTLRNNANKGAALNASGTAERGTFSGTTWTGVALETTNNTIQ
jgi:uncharacterized repeat protein (TIGR02543 family)